MASCEFGRGEVGVGLAGEAPSCLSHPLIPYTRLKLLDGLRILLRPP